MSLACKQAFLDMQVSFNNFVNRDIDLVKELDDFGEHLSRDEGLEIIIFVGELSFVDDKYDLINFGSDWWIFSYIQLVLLYGGEYLQNKNCMVSFLLMSVGEFFSDSIVVDNFCEGSSKIKDKGVQEVAWSSVIDINGSDSVESYVVSFDKGDGGLWFVNEAESIEQVSKLVNVEEIFGGFLQLKCGYSGICLS